MLTQLARHGDATLPERRAVVAAHRTEIQRQIARPHEALALVDRKLAHYDSRAAGSKNAGQGGGRDVPARAIAGRP